MLSVNEQYMGAPYLQTSSMRMCETWKSNLTTTNQFGIHHTVCFIFLIQYDPIRILSTGHGIQCYHMANTLPDWIRNLICQTRYPI